MSIYLTDTTTSQINMTLTQARHRLGGPTMGMVLTLVVVAGEAEHYDAVRAATEAAREHPSRIICVIARDPAEESRLDAEMRIGETGPGEVILLRLYGTLGEHADSVIAPLLLSDIPVVTWWPGRAPSTPAADPVGALGQRRITDTAASPQPGDELVVRAKGYHPGDTDFAWTRLTPWRTLLAAALDHPFGALSGGSVAAPSDNPSADLLAGWLSLKLAVPVTREVSAGPGITETRLRGADGDITLTRPDGRVARLARPDEPERVVALRRRTTAELLAEELRRLDPDEVYGEVVDWVATRLAERRRADPPGSTR